MSKKLFLLVFSTLLRNPHIARALGIQKLWMNRRMFKPVELTNRQTSAAINSLNNALPLFPGGTESSKFTETEIISLLEWYSQQEMLF